MRLTGYNYSNCGYYDDRCFINVFVDKRLNNPFQQSGYFRIYDEADGWRLIGHVAYYQGQFSSDQLLISIESGQTRKLWTYLVTEESTDSRDIYTPTPLIINGIKNNPNLTGEGSVIQPIIENNQSQIKARETYSKLENVLDRFKFLGFDLSAAALSYYLYKSELLSYFYSSLRDKILQSGVFWQGFGNELFSDIRKSCSTFNGFTTKPLSMNFYLSPQDADLMLLIGQGTVRWEGSYAGAAIYPIVENGQLYLDVRKELKIVDIYNFDYEDGVKNGFSDGSWAFTFGIPIFGYFLPGEIRNLESMGMARPLYINEPVIYRGIYSIPNAVCW